MKITPFQQVLKHEMARLESIVYCNTMPVGGQLALRSYRPVKPKRFLLQLFRTKLSI